MVKDLPVELWLKIHKMSEPRERMRLETVFFNGRPMPYKVDIPEPLSRGCHQHLPDIHDSDGGVGWEIAFPRRSMWRNIDFHPAGDIRLDIIVVDANETDPEEEWWWMKDRHIRTSHIAGHWCPGDSCSVCFLTDWLELKTCSDDTCNCTTCPHCDCDAECEF